MNLKNPKRSVRQTRTILGRPISSIATPPEPWLDDPVTLGMTALDTLDISAWLKKYP